MKAQSNLRNQKLIGKDKFSEFKHGLILPQSLINVRIYMKQLIKQIKKMPGLAPLALLLVFISALSSNKHQAGKLNEFIIFNGMRAICNVPL